MVINADFAKLIDDDRNPSAVIGGENTIQKCGFASAQKTGEHSNRNAGIVVR